MRACIDEAVEFAVLAAGDDDGLPADVGGEVVARIRHLTLVGQVDPVALEDVAHLQLEDLLVGEDPAVGPVDAGIAVVDDGIGENAAHMIGRGCRRWCGVAGECHLGTSWCGLSPDLGITWGQSH